MESTLSQLLGRVVLPFLEDLDHPRALSVAILARNEEWGQLVNLKASPSQYLTADSFYRAAVATDLLRKADFLPTGIDTAQVARQKWLDAERMCAKSNARLEPFLHNGPFEDLRDLQIANFIDDVRVWLAECLGPLPKVLELRHGPGATYHDGSRRCTVPDKMSSRPTVSQNARSLLPLWGNTAWCRGLVESHANRSDPETVRGNRFVCVPKDATTDRPIAIEPSINVAFQLALGSVLKRRLKLIGLDLETGQALHRRVAQESSRSEEFATIDLSSASDTISRNLVKLLLPEGWYSVLDTLRSGTTTDVDGRTYVLQKFSSMGNGYTFELETMLFASLVATCMRHHGLDPIPGVNMFVYGDDIIAPTCVSRGLLAVLRFFGFTTNERKTFLSGNFRESCGGDFFNGEVVRPHYLKEFPNEPQQWITLANGLRRVGQGYNPDYPLNSFVRRAWFRVLDQLPSDIRRCRGPVSLGDVVIHDDNPARWNSTWRNSIRYIRCWRPVTTPIPLSALNRRTGKVKGMWKSGPTLASALYGVPSDGPIPRGRVSGYRFGRVAYS